jgi:hypothetical protein
MKPTIQLVVHLVFPTNSFSPYGFATQQEMITTLERVQSQSLGLFYYSPPNKPWIVERLETAQTSCPGSIMVFISHKGDWLECFNMSTNQEVIIDSRTGITIPHFRDWNSDQENVAWTPEDIGEKLNVCCSSLFNKIEIITFSRPGPDWFVTSLREINNTDSVEPLLTAVRTQLEIRRISSIAADLDKDQWIGFLTQHQNAVVNKKNSSVPNDLYKVGTREALVVAESSRSPLFIKTKEALNDIQVESFEGPIAIDGITTASGGATGLMFLLEKEPAKFYEKFNRLDRWGCETVIVASSLHYSSFHEYEKRWREVGLDSIPEYAHKAFQRRCRFIGLDWTTWVNTIDGALKGNRSRHRSTCGEVCEAKELFTVVSAFGHGEEGDITNALLAPIRVLAMEALDNGKNTETIAASIEHVRDSAQAMRALFEEGDANTESVIGKATKSGGEIGMGLVEAWHDVCECLNTTTAFREIAASCATMMRCLTEIRIMAGLRPHPQPFSNPVIPEPLLIGKEKPDYRMLVIDDSADSWGPVFKILGEKLCERLDGKSVCIEFSPDGKTVKTCGSPLGGEPLAPLMAEYDLILLDIYLASGGDGLTILNDVRSRLSWIPVIMWTSSTSAELPSKASRSNGFLFKKQTTIEEMTGIIWPWLQQGKSRRKISLLNPFFDHAISSETYRMQAEEFTRWALKTLDGFHALDQAYFRFFNDHGARHVTGVLRNLERLIRPLLFPTRDNDVVTNVGKEGMDIFPDSAQNRERFMLWLYIATLCHDIGMFPLPCEEERIMTQRTHLLHKARKEHGVRILALLNCEDVAEKYPELTAALREVTPEDRAALSLLTAYHSQSNNLPLTHITTNATATAIPVNAKCMFNPKIAAFDEGVEMFVKQQASQLVHASREKMAQLCALLRLADGVDIDYTRVPMIQLLSDPKRSIKQDCENFKRQVLYSVDIDRGIVKLIFRFPNNDSITPAGKELLKTLWEKAIIEPLQKYKKEKTEENEKMPDTVTNFGVLILDSKDPKELVCSVFRDIQNGQMGSLERKLFSSILDGILEMYMRREDRKIHGLTIAAIAALTVCCEVFERYEAIIETHLDTYIKLGDIDCVRADAMKDYSILGFPLPDEAKDQRICPHA